MAEASVSSEVGFFAVFLHLLLHRVEVISNKIYLLLQSYTDRGCARLSTNTYKGPLASLFRGSAIARMLDCLVSRRGEELSKQALAKGAEVSWKTVWQELPRLEELGLIKYTRMNGVSKLFMLDSSDVAARNLIRLSLSLDPLLHMLLDIIERESSK